MIHNKHMISCAREGREQRMTAKNPLYRIGTLINAFHSVELRPVDDETKTQFKDSVMQEIKRQLKYVSEDIHGHIKASIRSKSYWEGFRDRIM